MLTEEKCILAGELVARPVSLKRVALKLWPALAQETARSLVRVTRSQKEKPLPR
jgi:hypothetical protein